MGPHARKICREDCWTKLEWAKNTVKVLELSIFIFDWISYREFIFFKFSSKFCNVCKRNLHLFTPTLALLANQGSKINTGFTSSATLHAAWSAGLSCSLNPLRNQWIAQVFILFNWTCIDILINSYATKIFGYVKRRECSE